MAELYVIGEIIGASGFTSKNLCCKYSVVYGENWKFHTGEATGQTQTDYAGVWDPFAYLPDNLFIIYLLL